MPKPLHILGRLVRRARELLKNKCIHESRPGRCGRPEPGMVRRQMPCCRSAHGEPSDTDAILIDRIVRAHIFQRLKSIHFPGEFIRVAIAPVWMEHESVRGGELAAAALM